MKRVFIALLLASSTANASTCDPKGLTVAGAPEGLTVACDRPLPNEKLQTFIMPTMPVDSEIVRVQFAVPTVKAAPSLRLVPLTSLLRR
jgi:hypothetical protein